MREAKMILAILVLLGSPSFTAAECAWVLWEHASVKDLVTHISDSSWLTDSGYPTYAECAATRDGMFHERISTLQAKCGVRDLKQNQKYGAFAYTQQSVAYQNTLACLPDTIDPRESKQ